MQYNSMKSYLTFKLAHETFAIPVSKVIKILEMQKVTEFPGAPSFMKGVINLRGDVLPIIDAREKFGMKAGEYDSRTCILVLEAKSESDQMHIGAIVDCVLDVISYQDDEIKMAPTPGSHYPSEVVNGVMKKDEDFIMILNVDHIFSTDEIISLNENRTAQGENPHINDQTNTQE
jgi:purine-binding chemotaxis protein CheW